MSLQTYRVGKQTLTPCEVPENNTDARGILWMFEEPKPNATYVVGCDPTLGISGWHRTLRTKDDVRKDNAAIEVFRHTGQGDVQVAEYAAPIDPYDLADVCNTIGHIYAGANEDGQALMCIEVYPGQGLMTQRELISRFGYFNLPPWRYEDKLAPHITGRFGWYSTRSTRQTLWARGISLLQRKGVILRSPWLVEEMADCTPDSFLSMSGRARNGLHDDRVVAMLIAIWFANEWSMAIEPTEKSQAEVVGAPDWQKSDCTLAQMESDWNDRFSSLLDD